MSKCRKPILSSDQSLSTRRPAIPRAMETELQFSSGGQGAAYMPHIIIRLTISSLSIQLALLATIQRVSEIAVLPFMAYLADGMGRCVAAFTGATTMVAGAVLRAASQNVGMFMTLGMTRRSDNIRSFRFLSGSPSSSRRVYALLSC